MSSFEKQLSQRRAFERLEKDHAELKEQFTTLVNSLDAMSTDFQRRLGKLELSAEILQKAMLEELAPPRRWWWPFHRHGLSKTRAQEFKQEIIKQRVRLSAADAIGEWLQIWGLHVEAKRAADLERAIAESNGVIDASAPEIQPAAAEGGA